MGKYLHTSYQIFRNSKWNPPKEIYEDAISYFEGLLKPLNKNLIKWNNSIFFGTDLNLIR